jgi:hypothetical protein
MNSPVCVLLARRLLCGGREHGLPRFAELVDLDGEALGVVERYLAPASNSAPEAQGSLNRSNSSRRRSGWCSFLLRTFTVKYSQRSLARARTNDLGAASIQPSALLAFTERGASLRLQYADQVDGIDVRSVLLRFRGRKLTFVRPARELGQAGLRGYIGSFGPSASRQPARLTRLGLATGYLLHLELSLWAGSSRRVASTARR